ncbi:glycoside hydrolase family 2 protein [Phytoactinopolyspora halotolerans]|uniref:beta-mannosidase n=1 Tax=Phytoactinopolyspora halotolerans TaxID=1981512 RepID=A0A6L9S7Z2_9ACTN|nr:glycoside hydrolase family 2 protein [Phytoactinopolyspora halotolerans]
MLRAAGGPVPPDVAGRDVPATVPGSVHTDLLAAGLIPDPYLDDHERLVAWIGRCDWEYRTTFSWSPDGHDRHDLVFDGLDTVATVTLNGHELARTANQHRTYRLSADDALLDGANELVVRFASPIRYADRQSLELGYRPHVNHHPYNAIRKTACNFGWDWGPDLATAGIWRPVTLHSWSTARLAAVRPLATVQGNTGHVAVHIDIEWRGDEPSASTRPVPSDPAPAHDLVVTVGEHTSRIAVGPGETSAVVEVDVPDARRWWPRGYGDQPLYQVEVRLESDDGTAVDAWQSRVGFRTVRLDMTPDEDGTSFVIVVNDQPVFVRGANWIPDDVFVHRVDRDRYARRIAQAEQANINLLRVWGGGIFESDDFYELCDERGIMTWQDFLFACAAYAEEEPLRGEIEAEARDNIVRLLPHPSLVLWCGNNENIWLCHDWNWELQVQGKSWGLGYYTELLPQVLAELDPHRPYTPASPWSGTLDIYPNDADHGSSHLWDMWNQRDYVEYRTYRPRFVAEFGWQGPPTWATLRRAISDDPLTPESPGMIIHQKAFDGNDKLTKGLARHLPLPDDMEDWHWAMSLNQAAAVRLGIEHLRSWSPRCAGSIVWQLNDCWPVTSWAAVDGDGRPKPLLYAIAHAYADRLLTIQPRPDGLAVVAVNDSADRWAGDVVVRRLSYDGTELAATKVPVEVGARASAATPIPAEVATPADDGAELVVATLGDERALWFFAEYIDSRLTSARLTVQAEPTADAGPSGYRIHVTAENLVRDVAVLADKVHPDAVADDMLVTLLPGESATFHIDAPGGLDPDAFTAPAVLRSANDLVAAERGDRR